MNNSVHNTDDTPFLVIPCCVSVSPTSVIKRTLECISLPCYSSHGFISFTLNSHQLPCFYYVLGTILNIINFQYVISFLLLWFWLLAFPLDSLLMFSSLYSHSPSVLTYCLLFLLEPLSYSSIFKILWEFPICVTSKSYPDVCSIFSCLLACLVIFWTPDTFYWAPEIEGSRFLMWYIVLIWLVVELCWMLLHS